MLLDSHFISITISVPTDMKKQIYIAANFLVFIVCEDSHFISITISVPTLIPYNNGKINSKNVLCLKHTI